MKEEDSELVDFGPIRMSSLSSGRHKRSDFTLIAIHRDTQSLDGIRRHIQAHPTGKEAARVILEDLWKADTGGQAVISEQELGPLMQFVRSVLTPKEGDIFGAWLQVYQTIDYTLKEAQILALKTQLLLLMEEPQEGASPGKDWIEDMLAVLEVLNEVTDILGPLGYIMGDGEDVPEKASDIIWLPFGYKVTGWLFDIRRLAGKEGHKLDFDSLHPPAQALRYYRDRIALALGPNWEKEA